MPRSERRRVDRVTLNGFVAWLQNRGTRKKTGITFITFLGTWSVELLKNYLTNLKLDDEAPIYDVSARAVHTYFRKVAQRFTSNLKGRNPYSPHSLRAAFRTFLSDQKVDPFYIEYWMWPRHAGTAKRLHKQKQRKLAPNIQRTSRTWLTPLTEKSSSLLIFDINDFILILLFVYLAYLILLICSIC